MPLFTTAASAAARAFGFARSSLIKMISDTFARVTSGSLGTATSGQVWNAITGVWYANSGVAETASSPSTYPSATIPVALDARASVVSPSPGAGVVLWESDSGDWWGGTSYVSESSVGTYSCVSNSCCTTFNNCVSNSCCGGTISEPSGACTGGTPNSCCTGCPTCGCNSNSCCTSTLSYTTYTWNHFVQIIKSIASVISQVGITPSLGTNSNRTGTFPGQIVNSLIVETLGTTIEALAYSDTAFSTLLASLSETNSSPLGIGVGVLLAPSAAQGSTVGPFTAT
jgi:hypothetical protein